MKKKSAEEMTNAARAEAVFRPVVKAEKPLDEEQLAKKAFADNRERLKAERLAREAEICEKTICG